MENAQPFPESNLKEPFLSVLLWISNLPGGFTCPVLPIEKYLRLWLQNEKLKEGL